MAFSPDGRVLATGEADKKIRIWDVRRHTETGQPLTYDGQVRTVAFSPDGRMLAAGGAHGKVRLWDVRRQKQLGQPLDADSTYVTGVAFSPDRRTFASGGVDGIRIWKRILWADVGELRRRICGLVGGGLSHNEWQRLVPDLPYHQSCP